MNRPAKYTDREANKAFELFIASLAFQLGTEPDLAPPEPELNRSYKHPDVQVTIDGRRWAFECKTLQRANSANWANNLWNRVEDGVEQINASPASVGVVIISLRNLI